jgi:DNA-directed RNA polymerase specialized sigma24 family protein
MMSTEDDAESFGNLSQRYASRLLGFICSLGANRDMAEDLAQRTWMKVIEKLAVYRPVNPDHEEV